MWGGIGLAPARLSVNFVSEAAANGIPQGGHLQRRPVAIRNTRSTWKRDMVYNVESPSVSVDSESLEVFIDGLAVVNPPAKTLPLSQRYFLA